MAQRKHAITPNSHSSSHLQKENGDYEKRTAENNIHLHPPE
jgi:hypothetical protein